MAWCRTYLRVYIGLSIAALALAVPARGEAFAGAWPGDSSVLSSTMVVEPPEVEPPEKDEPSSGEPKSDEASDTSEGEPTRAEPEANESQADSQPAESEAPTTARASGEPTTSSTTEDGPTASAPATAPAEEKEEDALDTPQVEVYVPSMAALVDAARRSKTAELYRGLVGMIPPLEDETGEGPDIGAAVQLLERIGDWPDTSVAVTTYTQDRDGRARWAVRVHGSLTELCRRLEALLASEAAGKLLKDVELRRKEDGRYQIELPDYVLAVLIESGDGVLIASTPDLRPPETVFGQPPAGGRAAATQAAASTQSSGKKKKKKRSLIYCRLNLEAGDEDDGSSSFGMFTGISDIRYGLSLRKSGQWSEKFDVRWHPVFGMVLKAALKKLKKAFECPRDSYVIAAFKTGFGEGLADGLAGLPAKTIGSRAGGAMAFAAVPGTGFLPIPDLFYQFNVRRKGRIIASIREAIEKDNKKRKEADRPAAWHEERIGERVVFWRDPATDRSFGITPVSFRTVLFFDERGEEDESSRARLVIAQTPTWADDVVAHWDDLTRARTSRITVPSSKKAHWQARIRWRSIYDVAQPYLSILAGFSGEAALPPPADDLDEALADSIINVRIELAGLRARHTGPIPFGAFYVPAVVVGSLQAKADPSSETERERIACRHLRVLHHHAKLFKKDYGRWPATVAELDGYIDFATHPNLLKLRPQKKDFAARLVSALTGDRKTRHFDEIQQWARDNGVKMSLTMITEDDEDIDDSLYVIDWSPEDWKLRFRDGEFKKHKTIYIDRDGEIHRVPSVVETESAEDRSGTAVEDTGEVSRL